MLNMKPYTLRREFPYYDPFRALANPESFFGAGAMPVFKTDIRETETGYELEADLPGCKKEDIAVEIEEGVLTITAERKREEHSEDEKKGYTHTERSFGSVSRSFDLTGIDADAVTAGYENGVLKISLPKKAEELPKKHRLEIA